MFRCFSFCSTFLFRSCTGYQHRDGNGAYQTGFMISQGTIRRGSRCSTAKAFLRPVRKRKNLHIAMHSHVLQILIDPITYQAYGVKFERKGKIYIIRANKEVVLSAGAVNTPQILMLSGVGPREHLQQLGIPVVSDLRVGDNLQVKDRPISFYYHFLHLQFSRNK